MTVAELIAALQGLPEGARGAQVVAYSNSSYIPIQEVGWVDDESNFLGDGAIVEVGLYD